MKLRIFLVMALAALAGLALAVLGSHHLITGNFMQGPKLIKRVSFSYAESVVNSDALQVMPLIAVRMQYPLTLAALERDFYRSSGLEKFRETDRAKIRNGMTKSDVENVFDGFERYRAAEKTYKDGVEVERYDFKNFLDGGFSVSFHYGKVILVTPFAN